MLEVIPFNYKDTPIRTVAIDGQPWFVAGDVTKVLGLTNVGQALASLDEDEKGSVIINDGTPGNPNRATVNEPGLYSLILRSRKPEAKAFKRWVTHEVLPSIRQTGSYTVGQPIELTGPELMAKALLEANATLESQAQALIEAKPKVEAFEAFLSSTGDYSVGEAAKVLTRDHQIVTGEKRLFSQLEAWGWIYRNAKGRPLIYQTQIDNGRMAHRARFYIDWKTGEQVMATPQVRITAKGIEAIATKIKELMEVSA